MTTKPQTYILSLGGSLIAPPAGIDWKFLKKFRALILNEIKKNKRFFIITGGGATARIYQTASKNVTHPSTEDLDWMGIQATHLNAILIKSIFRAQAYPEIIKDPTIKIKTKKNIIVGGGWRPGWSTDFVATTIAKEYKIKNLINLSNIDYAYDKDPREFKNAKKITKTSWKEFRKLVGDKWRPGLSTPFDPIASRQAENLKIKVVILNGKKLKNLKKCLENKKFKGTIIE
ncbi:MAG: Uridylate kinase [Parcubacteria group bacterium ADurb.Bin316]|nr:MAG: Uridylate kinase [Parcubacteria group bacterium ADurb.Bin316]HOZ55742.1 UMP kinase [bacterium]